MAIAFGFALFVLGFAMMFAGIALLIGGDITFKNGKRIPKDVGRKAAIALLSFFPVAILVNFVLGKIDPGHPIPGIVIDWPLAFVCLALAGTWLMRGMAANRPVPHLPAPQVSILAELDEPQAEPSPIVPEIDAPGRPVGTPARPQPRGKNPFDFS